MIEAVAIEREKRKAAKEAHRAEIERETIRAVRDILTDPLWSSVFGFIVIHEARRANLVGPVADDILYGGVIAINTARAGVIRETGSAAAGIIGQLEKGGGELLKLIPMIAAG